MFKFVVNCCKYLLYKIERFKNTKKQTRVITQTYPYPKTKLLFNRAFIEGHSLKEDFI